MCFSLSTLKLGPKNPNNISSWLHRSMVFGVLHGLRIIATAATACEACVCHAHSIPSALPCTDDDAFAEVIFAQHRMTPSSAAMGALLHLAQARGLCARQCGEGDVKQISYTLCLGLLMLMDAYGWLWVAIGVYGC